MSSNNKGVSKEGAVGKDMAGALAGRTEGSISSNYKGKPRNAIPNYPHNSGNSQTVADWTKDKMQESRKAAAEKK